MCFKNPTCRISLRSQCRLPAALRGKAGGDITTRERTATKRRQSERTPNEEGPSSWLWGTPTCAFPHLKKKKRQPNETSHSDAVVESDLKPSRWRSVRRRSWDKCNLATYEVADSVWRVRFICLKPASNFPTQLCQSKAKQKRGNVQFIDLRTVQRLKVSNGIQPVTFVLNLNANYESFNVATLMWLT